MSEDRERAASRRFRSTEHLSFEAVAAFVDGELTMTAHLRAGHHIAECPECAAEVDGQRHASGELRRLPQVSMPATLLGSLNQIPYCDVDCGAAEAPDGRRWSRRRRK
ncbi:zf-HC2 domain-containing protein [Skermania piniformis]|uniref:Zf-HC2 domain-containing protein n=1 Tax=Skermania pinensis TaxID=39122 RepID=A0ABX8S6P7_9ACTN|nr:zf-HC2 domain-containing protein [Skermania piniformis]